MTEAAGGARAEIERRLIERTLQDESFRQALLADPRAALEQELGTELPAEVEVRAVEESPDTIYLVLPSASPAGGSGELSDKNWMRWPAVGTHTLLATVPKAPRGAKDARSVRLLTEPSARLPGRGYGETLVPAPYESERTSRVGRERKGKRA